MAVSNWQDVIKDWTFTLSGDYPEGLSVEPTVSQTISGPYEITTISFGFSGTAPYHQQKFTGEFSFSIEVSANLYAIAVSSDDTATLNVGELSVSSKLFQPASASMETWIQTPPEMLVVSGSYETIGGPYSLVATIELKRSLREVYFKAEFNTPAELEGADAAYGQTDEEQAERARRLEELLSSREIFGCGEKVVILIRNSADSITDLDEAPVSVGGACRLENNVVYLTTHQTEDMSASGTLTFADGEVLDFSAEIRVPKYEVCRELTPEEFLDVTNGAIPLIDYGDYSFYDGHYYIIQVMPKNVSFCGIHHWEDDSAETKSGVFELLPSEQTEHIPSAPYQINDYNACVDRAYYAVSFSNEEILSAAEDENGHIGVLVWPCPVRWSIDIPVGSGEKKNSELAADGSLPTRMQTVTLDRNGIEISVKVEKAFPRP